MSNCYTGSLLWLNFLLHLDWPRRISVRFSRRCEFVAVEFGFIFSLPPSLHLSSPPLRLSPPVLNPAWDLFCSHTFARTSCDGVHCCIYDFIWAASVEHSELPFYHWIAREKKKCEAPKNVPTSMPRSLCRWWLKSVGYVWQHACRHAEHRTEWKRRLQMQLQILYQKLEPCVIDSPYFVFFKTAFYLLRWTNTHRQCFFRSHSLVWESAPFRSAQEFLYS